MDLNVSQKNDKRETKIEGIIRVQELAYSNKSIQGISHAGLTKCRRATRLANWLTRPIFPRDKLLAKFANIVYEENSITKNVPKGWKLLTTASNKNDGYFGAAFWHSGNRQLVIAHQGTSNVGDLLADLEGVIWNKITAQIHSATTFADDIIKQFDVEDNIQISFTGHSLGAWLAQITTFTTKYLTKGTDVFILKAEEDLDHHAHTVGFDSPGCWDMLSQLSEHYLPRYMHASGYFLNVLDITSYISAPNLVNTCGKHIGLLYRIHTELPKKWGLDWNSLINWLTEKPTEAIRYTLETHGMKAILNSFEQKRFKRYQIIDWPLVKWAEAKRKITLPMENSWRAALRLIVNIPNLLYDKYKLDESEYDAFFRVGKRENSYDPIIEETTNINGILVHYRLKEVDENSCRSNIFTQQEINVLEIWKFLKKDYFRTPNVTNFLEANQQQQFERLPEYRLDVKNGFNRISCATSENLCTVIRCVKQLVRWFPEVIQLLKEHIASTPKLSEALYREKSANYVNYLITFANGITFKDTMGLADFLVSNQQRVLQFTANETGHEMIADRVHSILNTLSDDLKAKYGDGHYTFLSWSQLLGLDSLVEVGKILANNSVGFDNLLVIDLQEMKSWDMALPKLQEFLDYFQNPTSDAVCSKKMIIITLKHVRIPNFVDAKDVPQTLYVEKYVPNIQIKDLTLESQNELLDKKIVTFQEQMERKSLREVIGINVQDVTEDMFTDLNKLIDSSTIFILITGAEIVVGSSPMICSDLEAAYIKIYENFDKRVLVELLLNNEAGSVSFLVSGIVGRHPENTLMHRLGVTDNIHKQKVKQEIEGKRLIISGSNKENDMLKFKALCRSSRKTIYWLEIADQVVQWLQLYDYNFYVKQQFQMRNIIILREDIATVLFEQERNENVSEGRQENVFIFIGSTEKQLFELLAIREKREEVQFRRNCKVLGSVDEAKAALKDEYSHNKSVHMINCEFSEDRLQLVWNFSRGSLSELAKCVDYNKSKPRASISEKDFGEMFSNKAVVIIGDPGIGKSTTLTRLCDDRLTVNWVMRINLRDCQDDIYGLPECYDALTIDVVTAFLLKACGSAPSEDLAITTSIVRFKLEHKTDCQRLLIMFDGFDEVYTENSRYESKKRLSYLLRFLKDKATVWVAARSQETDILQNSLSVFGTEFQRFDKEDQKSFLKNMWRIRLSLSKTSTELDGIFNPGVGPFERFTEALLNKFNELLGEDNTFIGIPLQLRLIGEEYFSRFVRFIEQVDDVTEFENVDMFSAYEHFVNTKFNIYFKEKLGFQMHFNKLFTGWCVEPLIKAHQRIAFEDIFGQKAIEYFGLKPPFVDGGEENRLKLDQSQLQELFRIGLVRFANTAQFQFIHPTFSEYFVSQLLVKWLYRCPQHHRNRQSHELLLIEILYRPQYKTIRAFLNSYLTRKTLPETSLQLLGSNLHDMWSSNEQKRMRDMQGNTILHVASAEGHVNIISLIWKSLGQYPSTVRKLVVTRNEDGRLPLHVSALMGKLNAAQLLIALKTLDLNSIDEYGKTALHLAVQAGHLDTVKLLCRYIDINIKDKYGKSALYRACQSEELEIVQVLLDEKTTAIKDEEYYGILIAALAVERWDVVKYIAQKRLFNYVKEFNVNSVTLLHEAAQEDMLEVCKFCVENGEDFLIRNLHDTLLHRAQHSNNADLINFVIAKIRERFNNDEQLVGEHINAVDREGDTALMWAAEKGRLVAAKVLLQNGADVNARNQKGMSALNYAKVLLPNGADVNARNQKGMSALDDEYELECRQLYNLLLEYSGFVKIV